MSHQATKADIDAEMLRAKHKVLFIGPMGAGKSHLGNMLVGRPVFKESWRTSGCTENFQRAMIPGHSIMIVDSMGINDNKLPREQVMELTQNGLAEIAQQGGLTQVCIVMKWGRMDSEVMNHANHIVRYVLGSEGMEHLFIVFTHADRALYVAKQGDSAKAKLLAEEAEKNTKTSQLYDLVARNPHKVLLIDNPANPAFDPECEEEMSPKDIKSMEYSREQMLNAITSWSGGLYKFQGMDAMRRAYANHREEEQKREQAFQHLRIAEEDMKELKAKQEQQRKEYEQTKQDLMRQAEDARCNKEEFERLMQQMQQERAQRDAELSSMKQAEEARLKALQDAFRAQEDRTAKMFADINSQHMQQMQSMQAMLAQLASRGDDDDGWCTIM